MSLIEYNGMRPKLAEGVFIAEGARVIGDVEIGDHSSIWFNTVVRGDIHHIRIGRYSNIQDGSVCHVMRNECPCILGDYVTVGHAAVLHGCTVESHCLIGMQATLLNDVRVGSHSIVAARGAAARRHGGSAAKPRDGHAGQGEARVERRRGGQY